VTSIEDSSAGSARSVVIRRFVRAGVSAAPSAQRRRSTGRSHSQSQIVATETRTGTKTAVSSESSGAYTISFLAPGEYEIAAEAPGFKRFVRQGMTLSAGEHPVIDIRPGDRA